MNDNRHPQDAPAGITPADIYFVLFRHKWKIILLTLAGFIGAAYFYNTNTPPFQSEARLLIRYVADTEKMNPSQSDTRITTSDIGQSILNSEIQILSSYDLAAEVATNLGPDKILGPAGKDQYEAAAQAIHNGLRISIIGDSSVVSVIFSSPNGHIVQPVLTELINVYMTKHTLVHSDVGASDDFLTMQINSLENNIRDIDEQLRITKTNAGIVSIEDSQKFYSAELSRIQQEIFQLQEQQDENDAQTRAMKKSEEHSEQTHVADADISPDVIKQFNDARAHLAFFKKREMDYVNGRGWTDQNTLVIETRYQITEAEEALKNLDKKYPGVMENLEATGDANGSMAWSPISTRLAFYNERLTQVQAKAAQLEEVNNQLGQLERTKQMDEANLEYWQKDKDQKQLDAELGSERAANIQRVQNPSPPYKDFRKFWKTVYTIMLGGLAAGLAWAFLIEFYLDRSVKRPIEIQNKLKIPFFLSIPDFNRNNRRRLAASARRQLAYANGNDNANSYPPESGTTSNGNGHSKLEVASRQVNHQLDPYYDALRDRLVAYFESINLTRKPKLVAVTATDRGAGVSTIACGLAASLSETGDGRVLLVDMNQEHGAAQQFFQGKPGCQLDDALIHDKREGALVQENLYVVSEGNLLDRLPRALPKRFASLLPKLKASDYDYIIFDMPPVTPTSITTRLAGFMDNVMLVIESEKTHQQVVQQANALLLQSKANVTAVLNKTRHYIPTRLHQDFLSDI